jgi:hypothetical protein
MSPLLKAKYDAARYQKNREEILKQKADYRRNNREKLLKQNAVAA